MKKFKHIQGKKHFKDRIFFYNESPITFEDWAKLGVAFYLNEDNIYPPPRYKGGEMVRDFINEAFDNKFITKSMKKKYKLT